MAQKQPNDRLVNSRFILLMMMMSTSTGLCTSTVIPNKALLGGSFGCLITYVITYFVLGLPLYYMELIVGQFTSRDIIDIWKIRKCTSHVGYFVVMWQVIILVANNIMSIFLIHYFIISFEKPIPYYLCGRWANPNCNAMERNYTLHRDCVIRDEKKWYCSKISSTYPESQYWRFNILNIHGEASIAWKVSLAAVLASTIVFLSCFKKKKSMLWFISTFTCYPFIGFMILLIGSMGQKGIVLTLPGAMDLEMTVFARTFVFWEPIQYVLYTLSLGSGLTGQLAAGSSFHSSCYANSVVTVTQGAAFCMLSVMCFTMAICPYSYTHASSPRKFIEQRLSLAFEKLPRVLGVYHQRTFWLLLVYSSKVVLGVRTSCILMYNLLEILRNRSPKLAKYPSILALLGSTLLFLSSIPFLSVFGPRILLLVFTENFSLISLFFLTLECLVFINWYGLNRFCEDVHFMQGIQPGVCLRCVWMISGFLIPYVMLHDLYSRLYEYMDRVILATRPETCYSLVFMIVYFGLIIIIGVVKVVIAAIKRDTKGAICLDPTWGPRNVVLRRSRAMFTAQAMTKEYLYRQYHLKAGITARQRRSNARTPHIAKDCSTVRISF